jgi:hypothetical protein
MKVFTVMSQENEMMQGTVHGLWRSYDKAMDRAIGLMTALAKDQIAGKWAWKVWKPMFPLMPPYSFTKGWEYRSEELQNRDKAHLRVWITEAEVQE